MDFKYIIIHTVIQCKSPATPPLIVQSIYPHGAHAYYIRYNTIRYNIMNQSLTVYETTQQLTVQKEKFC